MVVMFSTSYDEACTLHCVPHVVIFGIPIYFVFLPPFCFYEGLIIDLRLAALILQQQINEWYLRDNNCICKKKLVVHWSCNVDHAILLAS